MGRRLRKFPAGNHCQSEGARHAGRYSCEPRVGTPKAACSIQLECRIPSDSNCRRPIALRACNVKRLSRGRDETRLPDVVSEVRTQMRAFGIGYRKSMLGEGWRTVDGALGTPTDRHRLQDLVIRCSKYITSAIVTPQRQDGRRRWALETRIGHERIVRRGRSAG